MAVATLAACSPVIDADTAVPTSSPRTSVSANASTSALATETPTLPADLEPSPSSVTKPALKAGGMAAVVTNDLVVRSAPGVQADSLIESVTLSAPAVVYVIDGPVVADGYAWYLVDPARASSTLGDYPTAGWVAAGGKDGEVWIASHEPACEEQLTPESFIAMAPQVALYCYAAQTLTVDVIADDCFTLVGSAGSWGWGSACLLFVPGRDPSSIPEGCVDVCAPSVEVWFNDLSWPVGGSLVSVTGHFDDAAAQKCADVRGEGPVIAVHRCRLAFIATDFADP